MIQIKIGYRLKLFFYHIGTIGHIEAHSDSYVLLCVLLCLCGENSNGDTTQIVYLTAVKFYSPNFFQ